MHITFLIDVVKDSETSPPPSCWWSSVWGKTSDLAQKFVLVMNLVSPLCLPGFKLNCAHTLRFGITSLAREAGLRVFIAWLERGGRQSSALRFHSAPWQLNHLGFA